MWPRSATRPSETSTQALATPAQRHAQRDTRPGQQVAVPQKGRVRRVEAGKAVAHGAQGQRAVADGSGDPDVLAVRRAGSPQRRTVRHDAERGQGEDEDPARRDGIAAGEVDAELPLVPRETPGEALEPRVAARARQDEGEQIDIRLCAHGREVREVHPEELAPDQVRGVAGAEVDPLDQRVGRRHDPAPRRGVEERRVVDKRQPRAVAPGERREQPVDEIEFAPARHVRPDAAGASLATAISPLRYLRPSRSRTAFTKPGSEPSKKASASPTYSSMTARAGTSTRAISS